MPKFIRLLARLSLLANCALLPSIVQAQSTWNRFRGENGAGSIAKCTAPLPWTDNDVAWKVKLPGKGNGSPIIHRDQAYIFSADPESAERYMLAYRLSDGKEVWRASFPSIQHPLHSRSSYASSTPCADEDGVYIAWGAPDGVTLKAFTHAGKELWSRNLGRYVSQHGFGNSPIIADGRLIMVVSQDALELPEGVAPGQTIVHAINPKSGEILWQTPRETTRVCYSVPTVMQDDAGRQLLLMNETGDGIFALDLNTGSPVWNRKTFTKRCVSSPVVIGDLVIGTEGSGGGGNILFAVDTKRNHEMVFELRKAAPYVPTPVGRGNLMFLWDDKGIASCVSMPSGDVLWTERIGGNVSSSPVIAGDKLIGISEDGTVTILAAGPEFKQLGQIKLGETTRATPALHSDFILVRSDSTLIKVGK